MRLLVHDGVLSEYAESDLETFLRRVVDSVLSRLELTSGSTLKTLRGPYGGTAFRCRAGADRIPLSVIDAEGQRWIVVHQIAHRSGVYQSHHFRNRLESFYTHVYDLPNRGWRADPEEHEYHHIALDALPESDNAPTPSLDPWLSSPQSQVLSGLLPFPTAWAAHDALLMIAKGAPGSGKTLVAAELADVAATQCGYSVLLLVPTLRLKEHYREWLASAYGPGSAAIELVQEYFQDCVGNVAPEAERLSLLRLWWKDALALPALNAWVRRWPTARTPRFLALVDAALEAGHSLVGEGKDALDTADAHLYAALKELAANKSWCEALLVLQQKHGVTLRCQAAAKAASQAGDADDRPLLVIVDECQDLVPEEWRALLRMVHTRRRRDGATRMALFGDEAQRLAPTSFAWNDLLGFCEKVLSWPQTAVQEVSLPGSFRVPRAIGEFGVRVFAPALTDLQKSRHVDLLDTSELPAGGDVVLLSVQGDGTALRDLEKALHGAQSVPPRPLVLVDAEVQEDALPPLHHVERLPISLAKGLEFSHVVVNPPFSGSLPLTFDRASALYTAVTRATASVLCLVPERHWNTVLGALEGLRYTTLDLTVQGDRQRAADVLLQFADQTSADQLAAVVTARIRGALDDYRLTASTGERVTLLRHILADGVSLLHLEEARLLAGPLAQEARDLVDIPPQLSALDDLTSEEQMVGLLWTGDFGAVMRHPAVAGDELPPGWATGLEQLAQTSQSDLARVVDSPDFEPDVSLRERLAGALAEALSSTVAPATEPGAVEADPRTIYETRLMAELHLLSRDLAEGSLEAASGWGPRDDALLDALLERAAGLEARLTGLSERHGDPI